ncbi:MAG: hypothetical protein ABSF73_03885 [Terriglobia bacterium]|jgi:hypothetical protein
MKKRFIICLDAPVTPNQPQALLDFLRAKGYGWWHWFPNTWLVVDNSGTLNHTVLRDIAKIAYPGAFLLVLELPEGMNGRWSGFGIASGPQDQFKWIQEQWDT